jgi:uncharacterized phage protein (TIGR01671 family)
MMDIEFRGKRKDTGEWVYGYYYTDFSWHKISLVKRDSRKHIFGEGAVFEVHRKTVGMYTGLKDKNGKRIFVGDVIKTFRGGVFDVRYGSYYPVYIMSILEKELGRKPGNFLGVYAHSCGVDYVLPDSSRSYQIIGNIHEPPLYSHWRIR